MYNGFYDENMSIVAIEFMRKFIKLFCEYAYKMGETSFSSAKIDISQVVDVNYYLMASEDQSSSDEEIISIYRSLVKVIFERNLQDHVLLMPLHLCLKEIG